jgi:hypothetical protein
MKRRNRSLPDVISTLTRVPSIQGLPFRIPGVEVILSNSCSMVSFLLKIAAFAEMSKFFVNG